jgi:exopolysaccharide biosynthesis predicted pyruvyltransferase EpsI
MSLARTYMNLRQQSRLPPPNVDAYLFVPRRGNTGDLLIADGCERYLRDRGIYAWRSDGSIEEAALVGDTEYIGDLLATFRGLLFFSGGGNVGIYPENGLIRAAIIAQSRPHHRWLVFPQSAVQPEEALVDPRVTVWCRDAVSQSILRESGARTALVPDIALYMDDLITKQPHGSGAYYIKRTPEGDLETIHNRIEFKCPSADLTLARPLDQITAVLEPYEFVLSDRLHGGLIALMMRKKVIFLPVAYHKIQSFFDTWLRIIPGTAFVQKQEELMPSLYRLQQFNCNLATLFCEYADPALERHLLDIA